MATPIEDGGGQVQDNAPDPSEVPGPNPAWSEVLGILPEQFHSVVTPHFQKWDQSAQSRIEAANESLKQFEPYKPFIEHGISNEEIENGLRLAFEIQNNPQNVYNALAEAYKFGQTPGNAPAASEEEENEPVLNAAGLDPELMAKLEQHDGLLQAVSQIVLNDAQAKQASAADSELDKELSDLKAAHGEYDEDYVLTKMMSGMSGEDAVKSYQTLVSSLSPKPFAPTLLGNSAGGSGVPSNAIDPTKLSDKETRGLVAQYLAAAAKNQ